MEGTTTTSVHEFCHFNVTVFEERQTVVHSRQSFQFEIKFRSFPLTNRLAHVVQKELEKYVLFNFCRCCLGKNVTVAVDLGVHGTLYVRGDEVGRLRELLRKIKFT